MQVGCEIRDSKSKLVTVGYREGSLYYLVQRKKHEKHVYLLQSCNQLLLRRAIGCFAFPPHASFSSDHTPLITCTRYMPVIISYQLSSSLRSASGAPRQPGESVTTHPTHS